MRLLLIDDSPEQMAREKITPEVFEGAIQRIVGGCAQWRGIDLMLRDGNPDIEANAKKLIKEICAHANDRDPLGLQLKSMKALTDAFMSAPFFGKSA